MEFLILPNQIFDLKYFPKKDKHGKYFKYIIWEHPQYFTKYKFNKKKLLLHRLSMQLLFNKLKKIRAVRYVNFNQYPNLTEYIMYDPIDKLKLKPKIKLTSPNFLLTPNDYNEYREKTNKFFFHNFYNWAKQKLNIIPHIKSQDKLNRNKLPKSYKIYALPKNSSIHMRDANKYINKHFAKNPGTTDGFNYPFNHKTAMKWMSHFMNLNFDNFGPYQDAVDTTNSYLYHSALSSSINIGLLHPSDIINIIEQIDIPIQSYEAYIRQLFWREYQRYCYIYFDFSSNYFNNKTALSKTWYNAKTGITQLDSIIKRAFDNAYLNHIERLMVVGSFMNMTGISPKDGFKWYMEFAIDSYEWVMYQNVYEMVFFVSGGKTMRRPYISSSKYLKRITNWPDGNWQQAWDNAYKKFIVKHKKKLHKFGMYRVITKLK